MIANPCQIVIPCPLSARRPAKTHPDPDKGGRRSRPHPNRVDPAGNKNRVVFSKCVSEVSYFRDEAAGRITGFEDDGSDRKCACRKIRPEVGTTLEHILKGRECDFRIEIGAKRHSPGLKTGPGHKNKTHTFDLIDRMN